MLHDKCESIGFSLTLLNYWLFLINRGLKSLKRKKTLNFNELNCFIGVDCSGNTPDSGPNSPPVAGGSRGSPTNAPIQEENEDPQYAHTSRSSINDLSLFSSPSMPNISLGRPHLIHPHNSSHLVSIIGWKVKREIC